MNYRKSLEDNHMYDHILSSKYIYGRQQDLPMLFYQTKTKSVKCEYGYTAP